jgi:hypothetical protein
MALQLTKRDIGLRVVHPNWRGMILYGTISDVPNKWHADINTQIGKVRAAQDSLVWAQDFKKAQR